MFKILCERKLVNRAQLDRLKAQVQSCADIAIKGSRGRGWTYKIERIHDPVEKGNETIYKALVVFNPTSARETLRSKWPAIVTRFAQAGSASALKSQPWVVLEPSGYKTVSVVASDPPPNTVLDVDLEDSDDDKIKTIGEINLNPGDGFSRIFSRDAQIRRIMSALELGVKTNWNKRKNCLLDGLPGCGKTEIMLCLQSILGKENEAWMKFDATSMTKAGMIELIMKNKFIPPVWFIEEIEKCEEAALRFLLGVMDARGEIRRTNYRVGNECKDVRVVVIASANDVKLLRNMMSGALYYRFQNKIYCPEPNRHIMGQILARELKEINGKPEWIEPALEFGFDKWGITDPRDVVNIMSCGGDRLLGAGEYQNDYEETMHPLEKRHLIKRLKQRTVRAEKLQQELKEFESIRAA